MAIGELFLWSPARGEWVSCPPDEVTWLDRGLLSRNEDLTLHRAPRCAGLRHVHHRWELFSRDKTHRVYLARADQADRTQGGSGRGGGQAGGAPPRAVPRAEAVQRAAKHVLPVAPAHYEALPVVLEEGAWLVSVGSWVVRLRLEASPHAGERPAAAPGDLSPATQDGRVRSRASLASRGRPPGEEEVARVRGYFERNTTARMAMAYYYQEFILGLPAPQTVPMMDVVIALDLSGEGAVSDYKKLLQGLIWKERGHSRNLPDFLLSNGLLTPVDLDQARRIAADNERRGVCEQARQRLQYRPKEN